jgi:hypothetical protein
VTFLLCLPAPLKVERRDAKARRTFGRKLILRAGHQPCSHFESPEEPSNIAAEVPLACCWRLVSLQTAPEVDRDDGWYFVRRLKKNRRFNGHGGRHPHRNAYRTKSG